VAADSVATVIGRPILPYIYVCIYSTCVCVRVRANFAVHIMKAYWEVEAWIAAEIHVDAFLTSTPGGGSGQFDVLAMIPPGKSLRHRLNGRLPGLKS
jgi:hypothetical protein